MQWQGQLPVNRQLVHWRLLRGRDDRVRNAGLAGGGNDFRVIRIEEHLQLLRIQVMLVRRTGHFVDFVRVIQQYAQITNTTDAGLRTDGRHAGLDTRVAEDALLGFSALPVVVNLLVWAAADAHAPAAALILVNQHNAVFFALVNGAAGAGSGTGRVQTVLAQARQIHHEGVFILPINIGLHSVKVLVLAPLFKLGTEDLFPVGTPFDFLHALAGNHRARTGHRLVWYLGRGMQMLIIKIKRLVVVVDLRQVRVGKDVGQHAELAANARVNAAVSLAHPATFPLFLVFPLFRVADARLGFDVVKPGVFHAFTAGPDVFTGHRTGVTTDAFVQIQNHGNL